MRFRLMTATLAVGLLAVQSANAVVIDGRDWRQLTETTNFSWLVVNTACPTGICSGSIGDVSLDGWTWASDSDVLGLFDTLIDPATGNFPNGSTYYETALSTDIANAIGSVFDPTSVFALGTMSWREVRGITRNADNGTTSMGYLSDNPFANGPDVAALDTTWPTNFGTSSTGLWMYRTVETTPVPEPATLTLFGLGLAGLAFMRRRRATA